MKLRIVSNPSTRSLRLIVCEQSRTSSMIMPAWCSSAIWIWLCLWFSCRTEGASYARRGRVRFCCVLHISGSISNTILFRVARTHQQACVACIQFVTLRDICQCDVLFFGVQFVRNMAFALRNAWRLFQLVHKTNFAVHGTQDEVTEIQR